MLLHPCDKNWVRRRNGPGELPLSGRLGIARWLYGVGFDRMLVVNVVLSFEFMSGGYVRCLFKINFNLRDAYFAFVSIYFSALNSS